jgi:hypothetical protein
LCQQGIGEVGSDKTCSTGDEYAHRCILSSWSHLTSHAGNSQVSG